MNKIIPFFLVLTFIAASFILKVPHLDDPYFGQHISRQLQTVATIDYYTHFGIDPLYPRVNYEGWPGYLIYEMPLYQMLTTWLAPSPDKTLITARMLNIFFGALSTIFLYLIAAFWFNRRVGVYTALIFTFVPLNIAFMQSSLPDISAVAMALGALLFLIYWHHLRKWWLIIPYCLLGSIASLIKPIFLLPALIYIGFFIIQKLFIQKSTKIGPLIKEYIPFIIATFVIGVLCLLWINHSHTVHEGSGLLKHLSWKALLHPKFYYVIVIRILRQLLNPFNTLLFVIGGFYLIKNYRSKEQITLLIIPFLFYPLFAHVATVHTYYSLSMSPYFCMIAGLGLFWIEEKLRCDNKKVVVIIIITILCGFSALSSVVMYLNYVTTSMILPNQRYTEMTNEVGHLLEPMQFSTVIINPNGNFSLEERLRHLPSRYIKSFFKKPSAAQLSERVSNDHPLVMSATMYALKQYGRCIYIDDISTFDLENTKEDFKGHLRYVIYYLYDDHKQIYQQMSGYRPVFEDKKWVVYDLAAK